MSMPPPDPPYRYPYMWYYETSVTNNLDVPLQIVWWEAFCREGNRWVPVFSEDGPNRAGSDFTLWFTDGVRVVDGVIPPGETAIDAENWTDSSGRSSFQVKWAFVAVDSEWVEYYAEAIIECAAIDENDP